MVSEGSYIRSFGEIIANKLGTDGALSFLHRVSEGDFVFENERELNPLDFLDVPKNRYLGDVENIKLGRKLSILDFEKKDAGKYLIVLENQFSIIQIHDEAVKYLLNKVLLK